MVRSKRQFLGMRFSKKRLVALCLVAVLLLIAGFIWVKASDNPPSSTTGTEATGNKPYVNLNPPTDQEKKDTEAHKSELSQSTTPPPTSSNGKKQVTPVITSADSTSIRAYVPGIFEDNGTCTATITNTATSQVTTSSSQGFGNASYTSCAPISGLAKGKWSVVVSYSSSTAEGKSQPYSKEL